MIYKGHCGGCLDILTDILLSVDSYILHQFNDISVLYYLQKLKIKKLLVWRKTLQTLPIYVFFLLNVNFENLTVRLYVLYVLNMC